MNLIELCDPVFAEVCLLNRAVGHPAAPGFDRVRERFRELIEHARRTAKTEAILAAEYQRVDEPLIVFVDNMIAESGLAFAAKWNDKRLAHEMLAPPVLNGEDRFFQHLEEALNERGPIGGDLRMFYYICLGLGFAERGPLPAQLLQARMQLLATSLKDRIDFGVEAKLFPKAYEDVDERDLTKTLRTPLKWTAVAASAALLAILIGGTVLAWVQSNDLRRVLTALTQKASHIEAVSRGDAARRDR